MCQQATFHSRIPKRCIPPSSPQLVFGEFFSQKCGKIINVIFIDITLNMKIVEESIQS